MNLDPGWNAIQSCFDREDLKRSLFAIVEDVEKEILQIEMSANPETGSHPLWQRVLFRHQGLHNKRSRIATVLRRKFFAKLDRPYPITFEELLDLTERWLTQGVNRFDEAYLQLQFAVGSATDSHAWNKPHVVWKTEWNQDRLALRDEDLAGALFAAQGFVVGVEKVLYRSVWRANECAALLGNFQQPELQFTVETLGVSRLARDQAVSELAIVLPAAVRIMLESGHCDIVRRHPTQEEITAYRESFNPEGKGIKVTPETYATSSIEDRQPDQSGFAILRSMIELFWGYGGSNSLATRLQSSIRLVAEADRIAQPSIAIAICFAGLEAILCQSGPISSSLARYAATLLQPDPKERLAARKAIEDLYDARSKLMHRGRLHDEDETWQRTRRLASGVVKAVMDWRRFREMVGDEPTAEKLFEELAHADAAGLPMVGLAPRLAICLPQ